MSKKISKVKDESKENVSQTEKVVENDIVLVRVARNFNDGTDNNNFVSAGPNTYYKTNKDRAKKLVETGYCEYDNSVATVAILEENTEPGNPISNEECNTEDDNPGESSNPDNTDNGKTDDIVDNNIEDNNSGENSNLDNTENNTNDDNNKNENPNE